MMQKDTDHNRKLYIFCTMGFSEVGGAQWYVKSKIEYLQKRGWEVVIFNLDFRNQESVFPNVEYLIRRVPEMRILPSCLSCRQVNYVMNKMLQVIPDVKYEQIIIESANETLASWGELLAKKLNAKHLVFILNETFRGKNKYYTQLFDFFKFKLQRKELAGITSGSLQKLFDGYLDLIEEQDYYLTACEGSPVQDVSNTQIDNLEKADWNICSIGRLQKDYIPYMFNGVRDFALKYPDKKINFIIVGDASSSQVILTQTFSSIKNINVVELGVLAPIPKNLYSKIDVVLATAGCALISVYENVPVLTIDANNYKVNGILGYTTLSVIYHDVKDIQKDYVEALEDVLIDKTWKQSPFLFQGQSYFDETIYDQHFDFLNKSSQVKEYFDVMSLSTPFKIRMHQRKKYYLVRLRNFLCQFPIISYPWNFLRNIYLSLSRGFQCLFYK